MHIALYIAISVLSVAIITIWVALRRRPARRDSICLKLSLVLVACLLLLPLVRSKDLLFGLSGAGIWLFNAWLFYRAWRSRKKSDESLKEMEKRLMPGEHVFTDYKAIHEARNADEARRRIC